MNTVHFSRATACRQVLLPAHQQDNARPNDSMPRALRGSERVLVVDDEEALASMLQEMLTQLGYQVVSFNKSSEALQYLEANPDTVDLMITDQTMPKLAGLDLVEKARQCKANLPVVLCSGCGDQELVARARRTRVRFAPKPVSLRELSAAMRTVLSPSAN